MQKPKPPATGNFTVPTQHQQHVSRIENVDDIFQQLCENFSNEQTHTWTHMISMHRHDSYELLPDKPFFRKRKVPKMPSGDDSTGVSPGEKLSMRRECIDQLHKWHDLYEKRAISKEQYEEFQSSIPEDVVFDNVIQITRYKSLICRFIQYSIFDFYVTNTMIDIFYVVCPVVPRIVNIIVHFIDFKFCRF